MTYDIRPARLGDIPRVHAIERIIEDTPATEEELVARYMMFRQGFLVAEKQGRVVGYAESCRWNEDSFSSFEEIRDFPLLHRPDGRIWYCIFLGVQLEHRREGIGSALIQRAVSEATLARAERVQLVAGEGFLPDMYERLGFRRMRALPCFVPGLTGTLMERTISASR